MPPRTVDIPLDLRYRKLLEDTRILEQEIKEERRRRIQAELRAQELEKSYPESGMRFDRLEDENKKLRARLKKLDKKKT